jgi:hypothetical protein
MTYGNRIGLDFFLDGVQLKVILMRKEAVVAHFKVIVHYFHMGSEVNRLGCGHTAFVFGRYFTLTYTADNGRTNKCV